MMVEIDTEARATYIALTDHPIVRTVDVTEHVAVDLDEDGRPVGVEFLMLPASITDDLIGELERTHPDLRVLAKDPSAWRLAPA